MKQELHTTTQTRDWKELGGGVKRRIRSYSNNIMAVEVSFEKDAVGAVHNHPHEQLAYCICGSFRFNIDGTDYILKAGDTLVFPSNVPHGCVALEPSVLLDVFAPVREDFLEADNL